MKNHLILVLAALSVLCLGGAVGFALGHHDHHDEADDDHEHGVELSPQTMKNLGIELRNLRPGTYVRHQELLGELVEAPLSRRQVYAPVDGVVVALPLRPQAVVAAGAPLLELLRDELPRPELRLTAPIFAPINEHLHEALRELRAANVKLAGVERELIRLQKLNSGAAPLVRGQRLIDLRLERDQLRQRLQSAEAELEHHGLGPVEIEAVRRGEHPERGAALWQRALRVHGLWSETLAELRAQLPAAVRDRAWTLALLGELAAGGLDAEALLAALKAEPRLRKGFITAASLMLQGRSLAQVRWLAELGALAPRFALPAPAEAEDWDVAEVHVRVGQRVQAGELLVTLHNPRELWLQVQALGAEAQMLQDFWQQGGEARARPLLRGLMPELEGLRPFRITAAAAAGGSQALFRLRNAQLPRKGGEPEAAGRAWRLRRGMRFALRIPVQTFKDQFVLPRSAVLSQGADQVVFVPDKLSYAPVPVRVLHSDEEVVVVASDDGVLSPGILLVHGGALALSLALQAGEGAGHGHSHPH